MADFCRSRWCPVYFAVSTLTIIAISTAIHSNSKNSGQAVGVTITHDLSINASNALRRAGFNVIADLLQRTPRIFLPPENSTIFAIKDSVMRNTSLPPWLLKNLLQYHTSTSRLSMNDLLEKSPGSCIPTLFRQKNAAITKIDPEQRSAEINHVLISNPDILLGEKIAIHGVLGPFSSLDPQDFQGNLDFIKSATCRSNSRLFSAAYKPNNMVDWNRILQLLSSNGFASFSIGLHSVLDGIRNDSMNLDSVTILAPPDLTLLGSPSPFLDRAVRVHILPQRLTYRELASLPARTLLKTLIPDEDLEIEGVLQFMPGVLINGVEIVAPDILTSERFVIHGISKAFKMAEPLPA